MWLGHEPRLPELTGSRPRYTECEQEKGGAGGGLWTWHAQTKTLCDERFSLCLEAGLVIHPHQLGLHGSD